MADKPEALLNRPLRPLLPAEHKLPVLGPTKPSRLVKPSHTAAACDGCRKQKTKCSGERPSCRRCTQRRIPCHYTARPGETESQAIRRGYRALQDRASEHEEVVTLLRTLPEHEAQNLLRRMRAGTGLTALLNQVKAGDVLLQMSVAPETRFRYTFPYRGEMPSMCMTGENPYLDSIIYEVAGVMGGGGDRMTPLSGRSTQPSSDDGSQSGGADGGGGHSGGGSGRRPLVWERKTSGGELSYDAMYLSPFHSASVFEPRLTDIKISPWTNVCDDDALMREILEIWFRCEYQFTAVFQKDLFLEDLAAGKTEFCSPLLVNIILAYASVCHDKFPNRSQYWNPETLAYRFLAEARRLWELVALEPHITTIQAGILFSVFYNLSGLDEVGQAYRVHGVRVAYELGILGPPIEGESLRTQRGKAFTAWSMYNWETLVAFSFLHTPLVKDVPRYALPNPTSDPEWYGEIWVKYASNTKLVPLYLGTILEQKTKFRIIMNEFCQEAYGTQTGMELPKARRLRDVLEKWFTNLPSPLTPRNIVLPSQLQLHLYYHHLMLSIFEPLLHSASPEDPELREIVTTSKKYMHTLVRIYYLRHGFEAMDLFLVIPLMVVAEDCFELLLRGGTPAEVDEARSTIILVSKGLHDQRHNFYLAEVLFRVIRGRLQKKEAMLLRSSLLIDMNQAEEPPALAQTVRSHWPVSVVRNKEELDTKVLGRLVDNYAHLNVSDEEMLMDDVLQPPSQAAGGGR